MKTVPEIKALVSYVGTGIAPDDDWMTTLIFWNHQGVGASILPLPIPVVDDVDREIMAGIIVNALREAKATAACLVQAAWALRLNIEDKEEVEKALADGNRHTIKDRDDKIEVVSVVMGERGKHPIGFTGKVIRTPDQHPTLEWEDGYGNPVTGKFPAALKQGLEWA